MNFAKYLLDKNKISKKAFVSAFVAQKESAPSLLSILQELHGDDKSSQMVEQLIKTKKSVFEIQNENKIYTDSEFESAKRTQSERTKPIGVILKEMGEISDGDYEGELMSFCSLEDIASEEETVETKEEASSSQEEENSNAGEVEVSSAALESLNELIGTGKIDSDVMNEFSQTSSSVEEEENKPQASEDDNSMISSAALESLSELVDSGKIDSSALDDVQAESASNASKTSVEEDSMISSAALESLSELVDSGKIDSSALDDVQSEESESKKKEFSKMNFEGLDDKASSGLDLSEKENFLNTISVKSIKEFSQTLTSLSKASSKDEANDMIETLYNLVKKFKVAAELMNAKITHQITVNLENDIEKSFELDSTDLDTANLIRSMKEGILLIMTIVKNVEVSNSEESVFENIEIKNRIEKYIA